MKQIMKASTTCIMCHKVFELINYKKRPKPISEIDLCCSDACRNKYKKEKVIKEYNVQSSPASEPKEKEQL